LRFIELPPAPNQMATEENPTTAAMTIRNAERISSPPRHSLIR
jgi:hypothetical protein